MFFRQKKGSERLSLTLINLIIIAVSIVLLASLAFNLNTESKFLLDYYSHDLAMTIEAMQAVPGDLQISYPLEKGYLASINKEAVTVENKETGRSASVSFHLLPGYSVKESTMNDYVALSKNGKVISIGEGSPPPTNDCLQPVGLAGKDFSVAVMMGTAAKNSPFTATNLHLFVESLRTQLETAGLLDKQGTPTITLTISSQAPTTLLDYLIIKHPIGSSVDNQNYEYLTCEFFKTFLADGYAVRQDYTNDQPYNIEIVIAIHQEKIESFVKGRHNFIQGITSILTPLKQGATP